MEAKDTLFHINWGDGDNSYVVAPDQATAIERMSDGKDMVNYVVRLDTLYALIFKAGMREVVELVLQTIKDEPEFSGDMPDELWIELSGNRHNTLLAMRNSVRLTKKGITERLEAKLEEQGVKDGQGTSKSTDPV